MNLECTTEKWIFQLTQCVALFFVQLLSMTQTDYCSSWVTIANISCSRIWYENILNKIKQISRNSICICLPYVHNNIWDHTTDSKLWVSYSKVNCWANVKFDSILQSHFQLNFAFVKFALCFVLFLNLNLNFGANISNISLVCRQIIVDVIFVENH